MNDLILSDLVKNDGEKIKTTSLVIAEKFERRHGSVIDSIEELIKIIPNDSTIIFAETNYIDKKGRQQKMYEINRDAFSLLVMGFTGERALQIKLGFIKAFNLMESLLKGSSPKIKESLVVFETLKAFGSHFGLVGNQLLLSANKGTRELSGIDPMNLLGVTHLVSESQEKILTPTEIGKHLGLSSRKINIALQEIGLQKKIGFVWVITDEGKKYAVLLDTTKKHTSGAPVQQIKWKDSVIELLKMRASA